MKPNIDQDRLKAAETLARKIRAAANADAYAAAYAYAAADDAYAAADDKLRDMVVTLEKAWQQVQPLRAEEWLGIEEVNTHLYDAHSVAIRLLNDLEIKEHQEA